MGIHYKACKFVQRMALVTFVLTGMAGLAGCKKNVTKNQEVFSNKPMLPVKVNTNKNETASIDMGVQYMERIAIKDETSAFCPDEVWKARPGVKYGKVEHVKYYSNTCKMERAFNILLPPSYDGEKKFPVVYFQHGIFGDENSIVNDQNNSFKEIVTNLCEDGFAEEAIFVFGHMYAAEDPEMKPGFDSKLVLPYDNFINELVNDLMPYIEKNYMVLTGRENTAVCGFSMGGRESLYIGLQRSDLFGYIGAIAPAPGIVATKDKFMTHEGMLAEKDVRFAEGAPLPLYFMVCCGTIDSVVGQYPKSYHKILTDNKVDHVWFEVTGADHNHFAIRTGLYYFMQNIFKK